MPDGCRWAGPGNAGEDVSWLLWARSGVRGAEQKPYEGCGRSWALSVPGVRGAPRQGAGYGWLLALASVRPAWHRPCWGGRG